MVKKYFKGEWEMENKFLLSLLIVNSCLASYGSIDQINLNSGTDVVLVHGVCSNAANLDINALVACYPNKNFQKLILTEESLGDKRDLEDYKDILPEGVIVAGITTCPTPCDCFGYRGCSYPSCCTNCCEPVIDCGRSATRCLPTPKQVFKFLVKPFKCCCPCAPCYENKMLPEFSSLDDEARFSLTNIWLQAIAMNNEIDKLVKKGQLSDTFHLIAHSQGNLVARTWLQHFNWKNDRPKYKVKNFIALNGPQLGFDKMPTNVQDYLPKLIYDIAAEAQNKGMSLQELMLREPYRSRYSVCGYVYDKKHSEDYKDNICLLGFINNDSLNLAGSRTHHKYEDQYVKSFQNLDKFFIVGSQNETVVLPASSCVFGCELSSDIFDLEGIGSQEIVGYYPKQFIQLGLREMYADGRIIIRNDFKHKHFDALTNEQVLEEIILPNIA